MEKSIKYGQLLKPPTPRRMKFLEFMFLGALLIALFAGAIILGCIIISVILYHLFKLKRKTPSKLTNTNVLA